MGELAPEAGGIPPAAPEVFGDGADRAVRFVSLLAAHGVARGLIGPREIDRLWDRHVLNSAVIAEVIPTAASVVDVGSGGGFPGVPLSLARPDLSVTLLEPMARRVQWLNEVVDELDLSNVTVVRGRAEEKMIRAELGESDVVTARAVAPLARLADWCLPLVRSGGKLVALKGASVAKEIERDAAAVRKRGGERIDVVRCGASFLDVPTTVAVVTASPRPARARGKRR